MKLATVNELSSSVMRGRYYHIGGGRLSHRWKRRAVRPGARITPSTSPVLYRQPNDANAGPFAVDADQRPRSSLCMLRWHRLHRLALTACDGSGDQGFVRRLDAAPPIRQPDLVPLRLAHPLDQANGMEFGECRKIGAAWCGDGGRYGFGPNNRPGLVGGDNSGT